MSDLKELIIDAQNGCEEEILNIIDKFKNLINKYAYKLNYEDATSDILLEFLTIIHKIKPAEFQYEAQLVKYIVITLGYRIKHLLKVKNEQLYYEKIYNDEDFTLIIDTQFWSDLDFDEALIIEQLLSKLTTQQKQVIVKVYFEGCSVQETARIYGLSRQAVNQCKKRALSIISQHLNKENYNTSC